MVERRSWFWGEAWVNWVRPPTGVAGGKTKLPLAVERKTVGPMTFGGRVGNGVPREEKRGNKNRGQLTRSGLAAAKESVVR